MRRYCLMFEILQLGGILQGLQRRFFVLNRLLGLKDPYRRLRMHH